MKATIVTAFHRADILIDKKAGVSQFDPYICFFFFVIHVAVQFCHPDKYFSTKFSR